MYDFLFCVSLRWSRTAGGPDVNLVEEGQFYIPCFSVLKAGCSFGTGGTFCLLFSIIIIT